MVIYGSYLFLGGNIVFTVLALSLIQVGVYIMLCKEPRDERDRLIESKSRRIGYLLMAVGVVFCMADNSSRRRWLEVAFRIAGVFAVPLEEVFQYDAKSSLKAGR